MSRSSCACTCAGDYNRHYIRARHEQSTANLHMPEDVYALLSPRLKQMMGVTVNDHAPLGEFSAGAVGE